MKKRFEGKNLEDALENASQAFNVERYRLSYHVVLEKRGFLGGMKRVVIEAEVNDLAVAPTTEIDDSIQPPNLSHESHPFALEAGRERPRRGRGRRGRGRDRQPQHADRRPAPPPRERERERERESVPEQGPESEEVARVREWCEELFDLSQLDLDVRTEEVEDHVKVRLYGRDGRLLVAHSGELLDSLQILANKALVGRSIEKSLELDCRQFKERRASDLEQRARAIADMVRRDHREQMLEAMSPIERRIVHLALQDDSEVATESRGEGFYKRIAIIPRKSEEEPKPSSVES